MSISSQHACNSVSHYCYRHHAALELAASPILALILAPSFVLLSNSLVDTNAHAPSCRGSVVLSSCDGTAEVVRVEERDCSHVKRNSSNIYGPNECSFLDSGGTQHGPVPQISLDLANYRSICRWSAFVC